MSTQIRIRDELPTAKRAQAEALATFLKTLGVEIKPDLFTTYEPFRVRIRGYEITPGGDVRAALDRLRQEFPKAEIAQARDLILRLIAKTKARAMSNDAARVMVAEYIAVTQEFPLVYIQRVIADWHKRDGDEAIFMPSAAELWRALDAEAEAYMVLAYGLEREINNPSPKAVASPPRHPIAELRKRQKMAR